MKILHTADWHIGKVLYKNSLREELSCFFEWLLQILEQEQIDLLLISGDVFDMANPTVLDRKLYFHFLSRLVKSDIQVIITGGNHDSIGLLNAPHEILQQLKITVIGGATEDITEELIEVNNKNGKLELIIAAVPFLRDRDLRNKNTDQKFTNRVEAIRAGIKQHYQELANLCEERYPNQVAIAMGHLFAKGALTSESERDIHIGNAAAVESGIFSSTFNYVALGHIHRPQVIGKNEFIRYSGSPIALSFSEIKDEKSVVILELKNGKLSNPTVCPVPKFRELKKIKGDLETVRKHLFAYNPSFQLPSFVELEVYEDQFSTVVLTAVENLVSAFVDNEKFHILKDRIYFEEGAKDTADLFKEGLHVEDLKPIEVFEKRLESEGLDISIKQELRDAFQQILEMTEQVEG